LRDGPGRRHHRRVGALARKEAIVAESTRTRGDDLQLFIELEGIELFMLNVLHAAQEQQFLRAVEVDELERRVIDDRLGVTANDLHARLWSCSEWEDDPEHMRASAESSILSARLFSFLASDDGRRACQEWTNRHLVAAAVALEKASDA
jgi:hypothetical protein